MSNVCTFCEEPLVESDGTEYCLASHSIAKLKAKHEIDQTEMARLVKQCAERDLEIAKLQRELRFARYFEVNDEAISSMCAGLEESTANHPALHSIVDDTLNNLIQFQRQRDQARKEVEELRVEVERMRPVFDAALSWHSASFTDESMVDGVRRVAKLQDVVAAAIATQERSNG